MTDEVSVLSGYAALTRPTLSTLSVLLLLILPLQAIQAAPDLVAAKAATRDVRLSGYTRARAVIDLATEATGKVEKVFAEVGEAIGEYAKFACLDETFINLDIEANRAEIEKARIDIEYFRKQVARYEMLVSRNNSSQQQLDEVRRNLATSEQQLRSLKASEGELLERKKRFCIAAPPNWLVIERMIEPGEWIKTGDPVAKIGNFSRLLIPYALSMSEFNALQKAPEPIEVELPDLGLRIPAHLAVVSPEFDETSRKIGVALEIGGDPAPRRGGIRADLLLHLPDPDHSVLLPRTAVDERYEQHWVERADGERIPVVYLGESQSENPGETLLRISHPDILAGQEFVVHNR
ncbi:MAG: efflux RND transporter periplasmic adaptor subunit [Gammaproteobacteria bacterium]